MGINFQTFHQKLCHTPNAPTALPVGVSRVMPPLGGITPLTCTIFNPKFYPVFQFETALVSSRFLPLSFLSKLFHLHYWLIHFLPFKFFPICVFASYRPTIPFSPNNAPNRHQHAHKGNSATNSYSSINAVIPEKKKIQYLPVLHLPSAYISLFFLHVSLILA